MWCNRVKPQERKFATPLVLLLLAGCSTLSAAYPTYYLDVSRGYTTSALKCVSHPTTPAKKQHTGSIVTDSGITFKFYDANGNLTYVLCPGAVYTLALYYPVRRQGLVNANPPIVSFTSPTPTSADCPNQVIMSGSGTVYANFTVPCTAAGATTMFKVTSTGGADSYIWKQAWINVSVAGASSPELAPGGVCERFTATCGLQTRSCTPSTLGYDCMAQWRNVTLHWSVNTTSAPNNPCTPTSKTVLTAADVAQTGSLHMAVQSNATGYVSLGFASNAGKMFPSDIIMGWVTGNSSGVVRTFDASAVGYLDQNEITANSWAYDTGALVDAAGVTTMCFSRRMADSRAKSQPDLRALGGVLGLNYAVSEQDALVGHKPGSVGGFLLDLERGVVALSPPPSVVSAPPPAPAATEGSQVPTTSGAPKTCRPSTLGYDCSVQRGKVTLHWTVNSNAAPANPCTPTSKTALTDSEVAQHGTLHMAVQSSAPGYAALGFAENPAEMYRSDVVLGWLDTSGRGFTGTYDVKSLDIDESDALSGSASWTYDTGVSRDAAGVTTICFSRRLVDARAKASPDLRAATGSSTSAGSSTGGRRRLAQSSEGGPQLALIWAINAEAALVQHRGDDRGGFYLDVTSGAVVDVEEDRQYWINVHGALMAVAWGLLLPLGTLLPAHRWLLGETKVAGKHIWFWGHMACQLAGMALFIAGFVVAFVKLGGESSQEIVEAHRAIGIAVMAAAGAQVVLGFARPNPEHPRRGVWNLLHHNLGRATVLLAWANLYIGIYLNHTSWGASYAAWITPIAVVMGLLVLTDFALRLVGLGRRDDPAIPASADAYVATGQTVLDTKGTVYSQASSEPPTGHSSARTSVPQQQQ